MSLSYLLSEKKPKICLFIKSMLVVRVFDICALCNLEKQNKLVNFSDINILQHTSRELYLF